MVAYPRELHSGSLSCTDCGYPQKNLKAKKPKVNILCLMFNVFLMTRGETAPDNCAPGHVCFTIHPTTINAVHAVTYMGIVVD